MHVHVTRRFQFWVFSWKFGSFKVRSVAWVLHIVIKQFVSATFLKPLKNFVGMQRKICRYACVLPVNSYFIIFQWILTFWNKILLFFKTKGWICIIAESFDLKMFCLFTKLFCVFSASLGIIMSSIVE